MHRAEQFRRDLQTDFVQHQPGQCGALRQRHARGQPLQRVPLGGVEAGLIALEQGGDRTAEAVVRSIRACAVGRGRAVRRGGFGADALQRDLFAEPDDTAVHEFAHRQRHRAVNSSALAVEFDRVALLVVGAQHAALDDLAERQPRGEVGIALQQQQLRAAGGAVGERGERIDLHARLTTP